MSHRVSITFDSFLVETPETSEQNKLEYRIFLDLLESKVDYFDLETKYMYSESTIKLKINELKESLVFYNLDIKTNDEGVLQVSGDELMIRKFLYDHYFYFSNNILVNTGLNNIDEFVIQHLKNILTDIFIVEKNNISDADFSHFEAILLISLYRYKEVKQEIKIDIKIHDKLIEQIVDKVNSEFHVELKDYEKKYLSNNSIFENDEESTLYRVQRLIKTSIDRINLKNNNYYKLDSKLENALISHINLLLKRAYKNSYVQNPLLDEIKQKYFLEFNDSLVFSEEILKEFNVSLSDSEVGYLAIYLMAINKKRGKNKRVVLICNYGIGTSQIVKLKIEKELDGIDVIGVYPSVYLDVAMNLKPDLVISTVNLKNYNYQVPLIESKELLVNLDGLKENIVKSLGLKSLFKDLLFFEIDVKNKKEFFEKAFVKIKRNKSVEDAVLESIVKREKMSSTYINNMVAIPHTIMDGSFDSFISVFRLKMPIVWDSNQVRFIFIIVLNNKDKYQIESLKMLYEYIFDSENFNKMLNAGKVEDIIKDIL